MIYLDDAATSKVKSSVINAIIHCLDFEFGNPSSATSISCKPNEILEHTRQSIADYIGAKSHEIYFTSGGSESNCWAIQGYVAYMNRLGYVASILASTIEHHSINACLENLDHRNALFGYTPVDESGRIDLLELEDRLRDTDDRIPPLVTIQLANNEIGTVQDMKAISEIVHRYGGVLHTDAVQAFGKMPIDVEEMGIDMLSASGHKFGCPKGIGFLYIRDGVNISPLIYGTQQRKMRGGTENVPYIAGMHKAITLLHRDPQYDLRMSVLRNNCIARLRKMGFTINGNQDYTLPNIISATLHEDVMADNLVYMMDTCGVILSAGAACTSSSIEPSHVLKAIGMSDLDAYRTIRVSLPYDITMDEIDTAMDLMEKQIAILVSEKTDRSDVF